MRESAADRWPARCAKFPESFSQPADINIVCHNYLLKYARKINSSKQVKVLLVSAEISRTVQSVRCLGYAYLSSAAFTPLLGSIQSVPEILSPEIERPGRETFHTCRLVLRIRTAGDVNVTSFRWVPYMFHVQRDVIGFSDPMKVMSYRNYNFTLRITSTRKANP